MLKTSSMLVLLAAMLILAACGGAKNAVRTTSTLVDEAGSVVRRTVPKVAPAVVAVGIDDAAKLARQEEVARVLANDVDFLLNQEQQVAGLLTEQRRSQLQEGLEEAVCAYLHPSDLQEAARLRFAQIAVEANVPEPDLLARVKAVHQRVSNQEELTNLFKLYCEAKELR